MLTWRKIDEMITASANGWDPARMNKVDLAILRLAVYEMKYGENPHRRCHQ